MPPDSQLEIKDAAVFFIISDNIHESVWFDVPAFLPIFVTIVVVGRVLSVPQLRIATLLRLANVRVC
jgi:hypothetical protein